MLVLAMVLLTLISFVAAASQSESWMGIQMVAMIIFVLSVPMLSLLS